MEQSKDDLPAHVDKALKNCELLRHTFNTIQALIAERNRSSGLDYCNAHTLAAAGKIVYERWEEEKRKLNREDCLRGNKSLLRQDFYPEDLPYPEEIRNKILDEIKRCTWYKMIWGTGPK